MKNPQTMKPGEVLCDRYRLVQVIGKGGMGTVWEAYDLKAHRTVALKMILPHAKQQEQELRLRLLREARAIKKLQHRNIVQIYAVGRTPQGEPFLVLEYLQGQTLAGMLKERFRIEPPLAAWIVAEVATGLAVAHAAQVIHRDLKPANIFLRRVPGAPKYTFIPTILDFGVCKDLDCIYDISTLTGVVPGSLAYMSPEQLLTGEKLDFRTDIWALGIVLFELLTGERPFTGSAVDLYNQIITEPVPPPSRRVRDLPPKLDAIVARCTGPLADRYTDVHELASDLFAIADKREMKRSVTPIAFEAPIVNPNSLTYTPPIVTVIEQDDSDLAVTLPRPQRKIEELRRTETRAERSAHGTEIMPLNQPITSPAPEWEEILDALQTRRQSSMKFEEVSHDAVSRGETQFISPPVESEPITSNPSLTTSAISAVSQPGHRTIEAPMAPPPSRRTRPFGTKALFGAALGVFVMVAALMLWVVASEDKLPEDRGPKVTMTPPVESATPTNLPPMPELEAPKADDSSSSAPAPSPPHNAPAPTTSASPTIASPKTSVPTASPRLGPNGTPPSLTSWPKPKATMTRPKCKLDVFQRCK